MVTRTRQFSLHVRNSTTLYYIFVGKLVNRIRAFFFLRPSVSVLHLSAVFLSSGSSRKKFGGCLVGSLEFQSCNSSSLLALKRDQGEPSREIFLPIETGQIPGHLKFHLHRQINFFLLLTLWYYGHPRRKGRNDFVLISSVFVCWTDSLLLLKFSTLSGTHFDRMEIRRKRLD